MVDIHRHTLDMTNAELTEMQKMAAEIGLPLWACRAEVERKLAAARKASKGSDRGGMAGVCW